MSAGAETIASPTRVLRAGASPDNGLRWWAFLLLIVLITAAVISRRPDLVTQPQFWGDESTWFSEAYATGALHSLVHPQAGYLCVASKIPLFVALHVPAVEAPAVFDFYTIGIQVLLASFLLTARLAHVAGFGARLVLCFLWIGVPNSAELDSLNNTQWMLAVLAALILFSSAPKTVPGRVFDVVCMALISVTGPFCVLLFPIGCVLWFMRRSQWTVVLTSILGAGCLMQAVTLFRSLPPCTPVEVLNPLGMRVVAGQLFLFGSLDGGNIVPHAPLLSLGAAELATVIAIGGILVAGYAVWKGPLELKLFVSFACLVFVSVTRRLHCDPGWNWQAMMDPAFAVRYWYIPRLAILAILVWLLGRNQRIWIRSMALAAIVCIASAAFTHWKYAALTNYDWPRYAHLLERAPRGTIVSIPVNPPGWKIAVVKR